MERRKTVAGLQSPDRAHLMLIAEYAIVTSKWTASDHQVDG
jgi:hypothetical protein